MKQIHYYGYDANNIYLDNGASTLMAKPVLDTGLAFLMSYGSLHRGSGYNSEISTKRFEGARDLILNTLDGNNESDVVIFTANTTDAINKFCLLSAFSKEDKILIADIEHSSNKLPWHKHAKVVTMQTQDFQITPELVESYLKKEKDVKWVTVAAASNITGYIINIKGIYEVCHKYNAHLFVDMSQYAPHRKPSLKYADVIAYCGHKMYAPCGAGILAGKKEFLANEGLSLTGGGNIVYVSEDGEPIYKPTPFMHEAGTPNGIGAVTLAKAHDLLFNEIGESDLIEHNNELCNAISTRVSDLASAGYSVYFQDKLTLDRTPILVISSNNNKSNKEITSLLDKPFGNYQKHVFVREGAFCAYRVLEKLKPNLTALPPVVNGELNEKYSLIRLSAGLINTVDDINYAVDKLIAINK